MNFKIYRLVLKRRADDVIRSTDSLSDISTHVAEIEGIDSSMSEFCRILAREHLEEDNRTRFHRSEVACFMGHRKMWISALETDFDYFVFLEDDATLVSTEEQLVNALRPLTHGDFDFIHLASQNPVIRGEVSSITWGSMAYACSRTFVFECLSDMIVNPSDSVIRDVSCGFKAYAIPDGEIFSHDTNSASTLRCW